jgi:cyclic pyranopterin phosphate synthase
MLERLAAAKHDVVGSAGYRRLGREQRQQIIEKPPSTSALDYLDRRILTHYHEALALRQGRMCQPRFALLYPTYACNHRCLGCDYADYNRQEKPITLSRRQLASVLDQIAELGVRAVELCGGGEPLLHPHIDEAIRRARRLGLAVGLLTNGTLITPARARLLVQACAYIRVSLEAGEESTFLRVKRPKASAGGLKQVLDHVALLLRCRARLGAACRISLKYAIDAHNLHDLEAAVRHAGELGVDSIQFKCIRNVPSELLDLQKAELSHELRSLRQRYPRVRILGDLMPHKMTVPCWLSPLHVMIDAAGDVFVCCYYRHRSERHRYGNVFERGLRELWYSHEHARALAGIRMEECEKYDCRFMKYAELMDEALDHGQLEFL